jgi:hypothetical protein
MPQLPLSNATLLRKMWLGFEAWMPMPPLEFAVLPSTRLPWPAGVSSPR